MNKLRGAASGAKERAKAAKERYTSALDELDALIERGPDYQQKLPGMADVGKPAEQSPGGFVDNSWRELSVSELELPEAIAVDLTDAGIETLGQLADRTNQDQWWRDIDGIGPGKAEKVADAFAAFWASHPEYCQTERPTRVRIVKDIEDGDFHDGDTFDVKEWNLEGQPVVEKEGHPLHLQPGDWEPAPVLGIVVDDPGTDDSDDGADDLDDEEGDDPE